jgi:hypothetical protein
MIGPKDLGPGNMLRSVALGTGGAGGAGGRARAVFGAKRVWMRVESLMMIDLELYIIVRSPSVPSDVESSLKFSCGSASPTESAGGAPFFSKRSNAPAR